MRLAIVFILAVGLAGVAQAVSLPFLDRFQPPERTTTLVRPEPAELGPHWWRYFEVKEGELARHIQETHKRLQALAAELPEGTAVAARPFIERIHNNLQALLEAKAQPSPVPPAPLAYRESYSVPQLLDIAERLRNAQAEMQAERNEVTAAEKTIRVARQRIDTLFAAYLGLSPAHPERVLYGLEIMADRSAVAVAEERLRVSRATLEGYETLVRQLADEQAAALERLMAEPDHLTRLDTEIAQAQSALEQARERVVLDRAAALSIVGDDPEDRATARYRQQRVMRSEIREAIVQARLIKLQAERELVTLLLNTTDLDAQGLRGRLSAWSTQLADIRAQAATWSRESNRERNRASELMAATAPEGEATTLTFLRLLNQDRLNLAQETLITLQRLEDTLAQADLLMQLLDQELVRRTGSLYDWLLRAEQTFKHLWEGVASWVSASLFKIGGTPVTALGLLRVALILFIAWWISYVLRQALNRLGRRREGINESAFYTVGRLSHYTIITIGFMVGLASIGIDFTNFALVAGAIGIGIGFGLQSIVNNFVSGLILLFERSLKVGDFVELASGVMGEVREISVRSTLINTNDNVDIVVPNSEFINGKVTNWTLQEAFCRIHIPFKVAYGTDKDLVKKAGLEAAERLPYTLKMRNPGVWLVNFGDSSLDFELVVWVTPDAVKRPAAVYAAYLWEIETALRSYNVQIPLPQRDLHLRSGFKEFFNPHLTTASVAKNT